MPDCDAWAFLSGVDSLLMGLYGFGAVPYPGEIASHTAWLYFCFCFNHRNGEALLSG
jgi:hypothetical protein